MSKTPFQSRIERITNTEHVRISAASAPHATLANTTKSVQNTDEDKFASEGLPANFTKGLQHDQNGVLVGGYTLFMDAINDAPEQDFTNLEPNAVNFTTEINGAAPSWRGWESPRTGHYHDLEGPDADAVGMAPAPELGSAELSLEMAEVYAMAMLRDVRFTELETGVGGDPDTAISTADVVDALTLSKLFTYTGNLQTDRRLAGRLMDADVYDIDEPTGTALPTVSADLLFRGSGPGAKRGHFVSQFMLVGNSSSGSGVSITPQNGFIRYGNQLIDQRGLSFAPGSDQMINWSHWLDVQNGANLGSANDLVGKHFIATPRDIARFRITYSSP